MSRGAEIECRDVNLMTPLMWAAIEGHACVIKVLMKAGFHDILSFSLCVHVCVCRIVLMSVIRSCYVHVSV